MQLLHTGFPVRKKLLQGKIDGAKGQVLPGQVVFTEKSDFQGFLARSKVQVQQLRPVEEMHLVDVGNTHDGKQFAKVNAASGLFHGFPAGGLLQTFAVFHEACRQGPVAVAWFDCPAAKQNLVFPYRQSAHHHAGVLVMNRVAVRADVPQRVIPRRDQLLDGGTADRAVMDGWMHGV